MGLAAQRCLSRSEGGHVRIFRANDLKQRIQSMNVNFGKTLGSQSARSLLVAEYLFWDNAEEHILVNSIIDAGLGLDGSPGWPKPSTAC